MVTTRACLRLPPGSFLDEFGVVLGFVSLWPKGVLQREPRSVLEHAEVRAWQVRTHATSGVSIEWRAGAPEIGRPRNNTSLLDVR